MRKAGARTRRVAYQDGRANLLASVGPEAPGGVMLSGHTDVVPVEGQAWTRPPFALTREDGKLYGRGTADMKGFVACAMAAAERASGRTLAAPLHLALSCDEEVGCLGVRPLVDALRDAPERPGFVIVGEPTGMAVATGHKGKTALTARCRGREGHSALAPFAMNALHLAADFTQAARLRQAELVETGLRDDAYDVPYTTLHVGRIAGGVALNIVPNAAEVGFEIRALAQEDVGALIALLRADAAGIVAATGDDDAAIEIVEDWGYPGLDTPADAEIVAYVKALTGANGTIKVAFGTEGGLFAERLGLPVVVCGPGSMAQGHKPDEFVTEAQMARCDAMLDALIARLEQGG